MGDNINETLINLARTINLSGTVGVEYFTGQEIDPYYTAFVRSSRSIQLKAKVSGNAGNSYTASTTNTTDIKVNSATSFGGEEPPSDYEILGNFPVYNENGEPGWRETSGNSAVIIIPDMPFSNTGINWKFRIKFFNADGQQATNAGGTKQVLESSTVVFNGIDELADYAEVLDLRASNADNPEGVPEPGIPAALPPGGVARLEWTNMSKITTSLPNQPCADGVARTVTEAMLSGVVEYVVFMFKSNSGSNPTNEYPSPPTDSTGSWYLVARTQNIWAEVACPINTHVAFWVGFGTEGTSIKSNTSKIKSFSYAEYS